MFTLNMIAVDRIGGANEKFGSGTSIADGGVMR